MEEKLTVHDLNEVQIEELKIRLYDELQNTDDADTFDSWEDIPDAVIFDHYADYLFCEEDFFCNIPIF